MFKSLIICAVLALLLIGTSGVQANVFDMPAGLTNLEMVVVGHPGNVPDTRYVNGDPAYGIQDPAGYGAVNYGYRIGKFEITVGQYCEFLNAVAQADTYELYNTTMDVDMTAYKGGCNIRRSGSSGNYTYTVGNGSSTDIANYANRPVNFVSFWDACRFANWLNNGQPTGPQNAATTEDGSYTLNGYMGSSGRTIGRNPGARWVIPSEHEWYKAAYHKNDGATGNYWDYPTSTHNTPSNILGAPADPGNNATYCQYGAIDTIGSPYWRTEVGAHENSESPFGTFDQGGNVTEWNDTIVSDGVLFTSRGVRGGSFYNDSNSLFAALRSEALPWYEGTGTGFRVAEVPEPATFLLLTLGSLVALRRRRAQLVKRRVQPVARSPAGADEYGQSMAAR